MQWLGKPQSPEALALYVEEFEKSDLEWVFGHAGYLINLGAGPSANRERSIKSLIQEVQFATALHLPFLVLHPGAHLGAGEDSAFSWIAEGLEEVFAATKPSRVRIALENTAGQGTCLGARIEDLAEIYARVKQRRRLGLCLDTAHLFAAGYDIRSRKGWNQVFEQIDESIGIDQVVAFHLNDSKTELGSRVDRHAHIGQGRIGLEGFRHIVNDARFKNHPACLETPKGKDLKEDMENLAVLRRLERGLGAK